MILSLALILRYIHLQLRWRAMYSTYLSSQPIPAHRNVPRSATRNYRERQRASSFCRQRAAVHIRLLCVSRYDLHTAQE